MNMRSQLVRRVLRAASASAPRVAASRLRVQLATPAAASLRPLQSVPIRSFSQSRDDDDDAHATEETETEYLGVVYDAAKVKKYSAELEIEGHVISGGDYWTALDAAKAYDELVTLYCDLDAPRNFPEGDAMENGQETADDVEWQAPDAGNRHADIIPPIPRSYLTIDEVKDALEREKAIDVYTVDLAGKTSLADFMVFATGRSQAHMRRMADLLIKSMKARAVVDDFDYAVEGRDCDDWMIADCNNIVVHLMRADTRRILALEDHWENMVDDKHSVYGDMNEDEYMDKFGTSELMEYLEDADHPHGDDEGEGSGVEWK
ncbi:Mitochondrial assembly of ribosomal large subunit protein 1 [Phytophthora pseudosyringae]|uniref:Mitochondrial assembly of ribosomal large subunit protein 1 n=1 Tax=Phytophthora pseudosyringae TaxID=221518 RepID=A0A8T1WD89_9STRA|nr:Mitochondrial assembly of ribosomal large subunit protein 1 [Phytophthora pseudosyringae]